MTGDPVAAGYVASLARPAGNITGVSMMHGLEGLAGKGYHYAPGTVTIDELNLYVKERVKELTGGLQHPVDLKPKEAQNFAFAAVPAPRARVP